MATSLILLGGFFEFTSCILFVGLMVFIFVDHYKNKQNYTLGINALCIVAISGAYLLSVAFAVDRGMAFIGVIKYMPLIPLVLIISQISIEERQKTIQLLPIAGAIMTVSSVVLSLSSVISDFLNVNGELSGFFQYPNTFAMFLTLGLIVIADDIGASKKAWMKSGILALLLLFGILASGSRTALVILVILIATLIYRRNTRKRMVYVTVLCAGIGITAVGTALACGLADNIVNVMNTSLSTFYGRLLYVQDAIQLVPMNPLGLGAWGYFFTQGQIQTGVYAVQYVHNDFLQLFLDAGWIAGIALIVAIVRTLKSKQMPQVFKTILVFMSIFMLFDFHLQYLSIFIMVMLCLNYDAKDERQVTIKISKALQAIVMITVVINVYMGVALALKYFNQDEAYMQMYPYDTEIKLEQLESAQTLEESNAIAEDILKYNDSVSVVYGAKAEYAYSEYDFQAVSEYKLEEIRLSPYTRGNYRELIDMMNVGMLMYEEIGDTVSALYCESIIVSVPVMLEELEENTSYLGTMIDASPYLALSDEYIEYIENLKN